MSNPSTETLLPDAEDRITRDRKAAARVPQLERELAEANANAPWLSAAHALCTDMGVPQGNISERIEALRGVVMEARKDAEQMAKWILNHRQEVKDYGCHKCIPNDSYVRSLRFVCAIHIAERIDAAITKETK